jgi:hypothetical protein
MRDTPPHLKPLEEIEREGLPNLVEVLREEGLDAFRHVLWQAVGWRDRGWYSTLCSSVRMWWGPICGRSRTRSSRSRQ